MNSNLISRVDAVLEANYRARGPRQAREVELIRRVRCLRSEVGCDRPPVDVSRIARHLGVSDIRSLRILADGQLRNEDGKLILELSDKAPEGRRRFTIAHEIGHLLLADGGSFGCGTIRSRGFATNREADPVEERWCDFIAAEVLAPIDWACDFVYGKPPGFETIQAMAKYFEISLSVATRRAVETGIWKIRQISWEQAGSDYRAVAAYPPYAPSTIAFLRLESPADSLVARALRTGRLQSGRERVVMEGESQPYDVDVWCESRGRATMLLILEPRKMPRVNAPVQAQLPF